MSLTKSRLTLPEFGIHHLTLASSEHPIFLNPEKEVTEKLLGLLIVLYIYRNLYKTLASYEISLLRSIWVCDYNNNHKTFHKLSDCCLL